MNGDGSGAAAIVADADAAAVAGGGVSRDRDFGERCCVGRGLVEVNPATDAEVPPLIAPAMFPLITVGLGCVPSISRARVLSMPPPSPAALFPEIVQL